MLPLNSLTWTFGKTKNDKTRLGKNTNFRYDSYLHEYQALGTAGGIYHFRDEILRGHTKHFFVMHIDIACSFPLNEMASAHMKHRSICTMLGTKVGLHIQKCVWENSIELV